MQVTGFTSHDFNIAIKLWCVSNNYRNSLTFKKAETFPHMTKEHRKRCAEWASPGSETEMKELIPSDCYPVPSSQPLSLLQCEAEGKPESGPRDQLTFPRCKCVRHGKVRSTGETLYVALAVYAASFISVNHIKCPLVSLSYSWES